MFSVAITSNMKIFPEDIVFFQSLFNLCETESEVSSDSKYVDVDAPGPAVVSHKILYADFAQIVYILSTKYKEVRIRHIGDRELLVVVSDLPICG